MESLSEAVVESGSLLLVDSAPIIYTLEGHPTQAARFENLFARHARGELRLAISTVTLVEVLTGPLGAGEEALAKRYRALLETWIVVALDSDIAESAARLRGNYRLKLPDAVQLASALAINAAGLVTHDRDFSKVRGIRVLA